LAEVGLPALGQSVLTMGYPLGSSDLNITQGLVSSLKSDPSRNIQWVQTDTAVNPGNSGGPMINLQGEVVGIITAKFVGTAIEGVGFAISAATIRTYFERIKAGEVIGEEP
jgi:serine protease Do